MSPASTANIGTTATSLKTKRSFRFTLLTVLLAILPSPLNGQFGDFGIDSDLLGFVPPECQEPPARSSAEGVVGGPELNDVLQCVLAPSNLFRCLGLVNLLDPDLIPDPAEITDCSDIEEPYCEIEAECEPCNGVIESLMRCIVVHSEGVDANITELVETCPLGF
mmetsp:Transcript_16234/g.33365  ORF Transcript_16234/g.33365 Transcript_16234/m.33365 type:complete len:165 (-) Transcript_16234:922-1416(-)|eukprot:CAMPEP_0201122038 /NCGR_PEP_ID=MMETSP0850-20130426/5766_1 /ASSEMBLY_ACC=CAM_ASM_000622 /TAXON_ID=183588 /ORGANISM="Pseudo-nitzschia fraudulenta, Strain WWA7" /LENGTH=164 /DNA_ID=CAMNT_0047388619 /DNA_START=302 /DNA_END=796 /DNA_ORIENTATION=+